MTPAFKPFTRYPGVPTLMSLTGQRSGLALVVGNHYRWMAGLVVEARLVEGDLAQLVGGGRTYLASQGIMTDGWGREWVGWQVVGVREGERVGSSLLAIPEDGCESIDQELADWGTRK